MENKKLGIIMVIFSLVFVGFLINFNNTLGNNFIEEGCSLEGICGEIDGNINIIHIGFGFFGFMLGLGFYLLFFNKTDQKIMSRLEEEKNVKISEERFSIILKALDSHEKKVMKLIKEQDGITQSTLRLRTDMSKAKLSYVLTELERRGLIKREQKGKSLAIYLKI